MSIFYAIVLKVAEKNSNKKKNVLMRYATEGSKRSTGVYTGFYSPQTHFPPQKQHRRAVARSVSIFSFLLQKRGDGLSHNRVSALLIVSQPHRNGKAALKIIGVFV